MGYLNILSKLLENLRTLDMFNCDTNRSTFCRGSVFALLPQLVYLNGLDKKGGEQPDNS